MSLRYFLPVVVLVGFAAAAWLANRSAFYPSRYPEGFWELRDRIGATDVNLRTLDGVKLHAWYRKPPEARLVTLFLHGNAGNVTHRFGAIQAIAEAGSAVLMLDYRGYGKSEGAPSERGLYRDAETAYQWLLDQGWTARQIVLHGESLGTAVAVELASRRPCSRIILEAPFPSARAVAARVFPVVGPLLVWGFDTRARIAGVHAPLLVIHGDRDEVIDYQLGRQVFDAAGNPKQFWTVPNAGHNDLLEAAGQQEYVRHLRAFYQ